MNKCYDKFNQPLSEGDYVDVQKDGVHQIYKKEDGELYFKPYGKEDMVSSYFSNDMVKCDEVGIWITDDMHEDIIEEPKQTDWEFEISSGYNGYRNKITSDWIYESEYLKIFNGSKQETLEEAADKIFFNCSGDITKSYAKKKAIELAKLQQEQDKNKYSEEEVIQLIIKFNQEIREVEDVREWFEQYKKEIRYGN